MEIFLGNFFEYPSESLLNFTDESFSGNGTVDSLIQNAEGEKLRGILPSGGKLPRNSICISKSDKIEGFRLIVHLVTPYDGKRNEIEDLRETIDNLFAELLKNDIRSVTIPAIPFSCYSVPYEELYEQLIYKIGQYEEKVSVKLVFREEYTYELFRTMMGLGPNVESLKKVIKQSRDRQIRIETELAELLEKFKIKNNVIRKQNREIKDSIRYAQKIQKALLFPGCELENYKKNYFILFKPKDIVSGDFYLLKRFESKLFVAIADCTGHGVPGAFMSALSISTLTDILFSTGIDNTGTVLDNLRMKVKHLLSQNSKDEGQPDGMDIAIFTIDEKKSCLTYSGANNPIFIVRSAGKEDLSIDQYDNYNNGYLLEEIKADRQPVSVFPVEKPFSTTRYDLKRGDMIYAFSDGFIDQFGGQSNKRLKIKNFKTLLLSICDLAPDVQKEKLGIFFKEWCGTNEQVDDVLVFGLRY
jgi:serine phosphatase RsbU (regulator of sigma subunit)/O-acetyl-ADP-ribose deacetylase (regulator of RNase III)